VRLPPDIRPTLGTDLATILAINRAAFGQEEEAELVDALLRDPTARPLVSLLAQDGGRGIGHVLFTHVDLVGTPTRLDAMILAPLAVLPECQGQGVGAALVRRGLSEAGDAGAGIVLVLGHPTYYPRFGFRAAGRLGLQAPYPIPAEHEEAWMVVETLQGPIEGATEGATEGANCVVVPAEALRRPELWS
jgi:putative acetyltransferase